MDIIIGRESGTTAPRLCIKQGDKSFFLGAPGSVPKTVSRSHCLLQITGDQMTISNVSDSNSVFVNGLEYKTKTISKNDLIELGPERYRLAITEVLALCQRGTKQQNPGMEVKTFHIAHLKNIWEQYINNKDRIQKRDSDVSALRGLPSVLSMSALAAGLLVKEMDDTFRAILITCALLLTIVFTYIAFKNGRNKPTLVRELDEKFQDEYICPNCKHFLGQKSYKMVLKDGGCPWCKSKFVE